MNNYQKYGLLFAIIFSVLLHLIVINNFSFDKTSSKNKKSFDNIEITLEQPIKKSSIKIKSRKTDIKKLNKPEGPSDKKATIEAKYIINPSEIKNESPKKLIDTSKILADINSSNFSSKIVSNKKQSRIKSISANTKDYIYRLYFEAWKQKVEQIGKMNYPVEASKLGMFGSLILTVSLNPDGTIKKLFINKTSGYKELDAAAIHIIRLGEPYAKFPTEIQKDVDILNITRKWKFTESNDFLK